MAVGGAGAWAQPKGVVPGLVKDKFKLNILILSYDELGKLIVEARKDNAAVKRVEKRTADYLRESGTTLETERSYVDNCFLLEDVFKKVLDNPFMDICRSQIDISYEADSKVLAKRMLGFHWMTGYGNYMKEIGYALKRLGIELEWM